MHTYKNYDCDLSTVRARLDEQGIAVIPGVFSKERCQELRERAWADFERLIGLSRGDPTTYENLYKLFPSHSMMIQTFGIGHLQWVWDIRQDPSVANVFSTIWETAPEDLLVSFDALSFNMPPEVVEDGWFDNETGYRIHTDQKGSILGRDCVQGLVNLYPINPGDATLMVLEKSHNLHSSFFESNPDASVESTVTKVPRKNHEYFTARGCEEHRVLAGEGSLVLWDSRTFHQGANALRERSEANFRLVTYVCMTARSRASPEVLRDRVKALEDIRNTSHIPYEANSFKFYPFPEGSGVELPDITPETIGKPVLTELGRRLAGYE